MVVNLSNTGSPETDAWQHELEQRAYDDSEPNVSEDDIKVFSMVYDKVLKRNEDNLKKDKKQWANQ